MGHRSFVVVEWTTITDRRVAAILFVLLWGPGMTETGWAQLKGDSTRVASRVLEARRGFDSIRRLDRWRRGAGDGPYRGVTNLGRGVRPPPSVASAGFGDALVGSLIGTAVGGPLGVLMVRGARDDATWTDADGAASENCCGLQRAGLAILGVAIAAGAGPYGAAERLDAGGAAVYAPSISGQLLLGGFGYAIGRSIGGRSNRLLVGLAMGVPLAAIGSAAGAAFGARASSQNVERGVVRLNGGTWQIGVPDIRVRPNLGRSQGPTAHIPLFSAQMN